MYNIRKVRVIRMRALENKKMKRKKLLSSGYSLFTDKRIHDVSIQEIVDHAGVAKGTFYLYFKDKYDLRDALIKKAAYDMFNEAQVALDKENISDFEDISIFIIDHVINQLESNKKLLKFVERNLSLGVFANHLQDALSDDLLDLEADFRRRAEAANYVIENFKTTLYIIIKLVSSCCYSSIIMNQPAPIDEMKPILYTSIRAILRSQKKTV